MVLIADLDTITWEERLVSLAESLETRGAFLVPEVTKPHSLAALVMPGRIPVQAIRLAALPLALAGFELHGIVAEIDFDTAAVRQHCIHLQGQCFASHQTLLHRTQY